VILYQSFLQQYNKYVSYPIYNNTFVYSGNFADVLLARVKTWSEPDYSNSNFLEQYSLESSLILVYRMLLVTESNCKINDT